MGIIRYKKGINGYKQGIIRYNSVKLYLVACRVFYSGLRGI